ncbi:MAG: TetR/AcrR family transcriptional regulator [Xanthomonadaceae bacterium]|nr:TetR/AcrR family transcriptional regulator [Xanthomonadaceae bacterium]
MKSPPTADAIAIAARALLETEGPAGVTMRRVADAVGITPMAIYRHYPNREALLHCVTDLGFAELAGYLKPKRKSMKPDERMLDLFDGYVRYALDHPRIFDYVFSQPRPDARRFPGDFRAGRSPTVNLVADVFRDGVAQGIFKDDDPWEAALAIWAHAHGLVCLYRSDRFEYDARAFRTFCRNSLRRLLSGLYR